MSDFFKADYSWKVVVKDIKVEVNGVVVEVGEISADSSMSQDALVTYLTKVQEMIEQVAALANMKGAM